MPDVAFPDVSSRERIHNDLLSTLVVEAGAGTGKTSALVGRILQLLSSGTATMSSIVAITFTEAAAAELRQRIHQGLLDAVASGAPSWAGDALHDLDDAVVTTIHGFAQRVLADFPLEAGLPLRFRVLDEIESSIVFERRFARFIDELLDDEERATLVTSALAIGITINHVQALAKVLEDHWHRFGPAREAVSLADLVSKADQASVDLREAMQPVIGLAPGCVNGDDLLLAEIEDVAFLAAELEAAEDWVDRMTILTATTAWQSSRGRRNSWTSVPVEEVREAVAALNRRRAELVAGVCDAVMASLLACLGQAAWLHADERARSGELYFHDLLVRCLQLLSDNGAIRRSVRDRYTHVLVDEFQDTDPIQLDIVELLARDDDGHLEEGKLFFVGDPHQSIYRFRGADPELYAGALSRIAPQGLVRLTTNFRSNEAILFFVNSIFRELFDRQSLGQGEMFGQEFAGLDVGRGEQSSHPSVIAIGGPTTGLRARERREQTSEVIAGTLRSAIDDGWLVHVDGESRPLQYRDVAVVVPRRTGLRQLESALRGQAIPYRVDSTILVYGSDEIRDLIACLRALYSPSDEPAIVAALRTPMFGCSDDDLLGFRRGGGSWRIRDGFSAELADNSVAIALSELEELRSKSFTLGIVGTVEEFVRRFRVFELGALSANPTESLRRLRFVVDQARSFVAAGGSNLGELLDWMEAQATRNPRIDSTSNASEDVVQILTIHGAKGLEFPVVVLCELDGVGQGGFPGPAVLVGPNGKVEARVRRGIETAGYEALFELETEREHKERLRLSYVGATRARDYLIVSLDHVPVGPTTTPSAAELMSRVVEETTGLVTRIDLDDPPVARSVRIRRSTDHVVDLASFRRDRAALVATMRRRDSISPSALVEELDDAVASDVVKRAIVARTDGVSEDGPWYGRRAATALGRAVHAVLQRIDFASGAGLEALARLHADIEGCPERVEDVIGLVRSALGAPVIRRAAASPRVHRELAMTVPFGDGLLEAVSDCCFEDDGELVVVDYKTDLVHRDEVVAAAQRYRIQVGAYAAALSEVLGRRVARCVLLFLAPPDGAVEVVFDDLDELVRSARAVISESFRAEA